MGSRIFPRVLLLGMVIVLVIYISIALITVGAVAPFSLSDESLIAVAENFMSKGTLVYFIVGGALFACATTINILYSILSRGFMVVSREGLLPAFLGKVSERFGTPYWGLTTAFAISLVALISIRSLMFFGSMLNLGIIFGITIVTMAGRAFPERFPELYKRSSIKVPTKLLKIVCWSVILSNSLIFGFFAFAVGRASILFARIAAAMYLYARNHKERLMEIRIKLGNLETEWFDTPREKGIHPRSEP